MDSVPIVAITGQVGSAAIGTDAFQEADIRGITMPITKHSYLITKPGDIAAAIASAFHIAGTGRPGPVLVDITKDALQAKTRFEWPRATGSSGISSGDRPHSKQVREAGRLIAESRRPVLYVGGGVVKARAWSELKELAELTGIPVITTLMARGVFPDSHPQNMGMPGMHGTVAAVGALQRSDLLIALGTRFDDRVTGQLSTFAPLAKVIHADIDPAEISKNRVADVPIVGDCKEVISELISLLRPDERRPNVDEWMSYLQDLKRRYPTGYDEPEDGSLSPQHVIKRIGEITGPDAYYAAGVGQHQMWASHYPAVGAAGSLAQLGRARHHGLLRARGDGCQGGAARQDRLGHRRRRLLPDDQPGARDHVRAGRDSDQDRDDQQPESRYGPAMADAVLPRPLLQHRPEDEPDS